jgi:Mycoplasma protein of unknown function, DUF285
MSDVFYNSSLNGVISNYDASNAIDMSFMFFDSASNGDISKWKHFSRFALAAKCFAFIVSLAAFFI